MSHFCLFKISISIFKFSNLVCDCGKNMLDDCLFPRHMMSGVRLGTLGGHDAFVPVFIMLLSVIVEGSIAMLAMALVVCFSTGNSSVSRT